MSEYAEAKRMRIGRDYHPPQETLNRDTDQVFKPRLLDFSHVPLEWKEQQLVRQRRESSNLHTQVPELMALVVR
jgi:hypothetical protein